MVGGFSNNSIGAPVAIRYIERTWGLLEIFQAPSFPAMYAIIVDGGRQYRVEPGMEVVVDFRDIAAGENLEFGKVLAVGGDDGLKLGAPTVEGAMVTASVLGPKQGEKVYIQKFRRRKTYRRRTGHRQLYTRVKIESITGV